MPDVSVIKKGQDVELTPSEIEMDKRAVEAVRAAIHKAKVCGKPIARYDSVLKRAYIEYPNGDRKYAE